MTRASTTRVGAPAAVACVAVLAAVALSAMAATPELALFRSARPFWGRPVPRGRFEAVDGAPGLYKLDVPWFATPFHKETLDVYALRLHAGRDDFAVTDAGGYDTPLHAYATELELALRQLMGPSGRLTHVLLTHGHLDHIGALGRLVRAWPDVKVIFHEMEWPFLVDATRSHSPAWYAHGSAGLRLAHAVGFLPRAPYVLPARYAVPLKGAAGDLTKLGVPGVAWLHLPGHSPSHVVWNINSSIILGGDIADVLLDPPGVTALPDGRPIVPGKVALYTLTVMADADAAVAAASLCRLAHDTSLKWHRILPYHDATKTGFSRAQFKQLVQETTACNAPPAQ